MGKKKLIICPYTLDELRDLYLVQNKSVPQIAKTTGLSQSYIQRKLNSHGIYKSKDLCLISQGMKKWIDRDELYDFYITQRHTTEETAEHFNVHERTIRRNLRAFGIRKSISDQRSLRSERVKEKYGTSEVQNSEYYREYILPKMLQKLKETTREKYGVDYVFQSPEIKKSIRNTFMEKYGVSNPNQSPEQRHKGFSRYFYEEEKFDSGWELALWIYAHEHGEEIEHEPVRLTYFVEGKEHYYFPDFRYKGELVEIKGNHLMDENGVLIDRDTGETNDLLKAKTECMRQNNVIVWNQKDVQFAIDYVRQKYGRTYLRSFKRFKQPGEKSHKTNRTRKKEKRQELAARPLRLSRN